MSSSANLLGQLSPALPSGCSPITYTVRGIVKDARYGTGLHGATVQVQGATSVAQSVNGFFTIAGIRPGSITLVYKRDGFIDNTRVVSVTANINSGGTADVSMSPKMANDQWRVVVKWKAQPTDLDTYMKWGGTKVCWYGTNRRSVGMQGILEKDDTNGFGPETLYLKKVGHCSGSDSKCEMRYMINDYTQSGKMKDISGAEVTLYTGDRVAGTWKIGDCAASVSRNQHWWHVFTLDGKRNNLKWSCDQGAEPAPPPARPLRTRHDSKCLDYNYGNQNVYMHSCHGGSNQQWFIDGEKHLKTKYNNKCLDYNYNNKNVYMHDCHTGDNQKWFINGAHELQTEHDNLCLDYNYNNGNVYMHACHRGNNQKWYFVGGSGEPTGLLLSNNLTSVSVVAM